METLVLNIGYEPIAKIPWQRAITLIWEGKVEVVEEYEDKWVRSVTIALKMPSVVRFLKMIRGRKKAIKFSRENVYARDKGKCQYCAKNVPRSSFTYDHVNPRAQGGQTVWENVVVACVPCNQKKSGRTPEQAGMKLLSKPIKPTKLPDIMHLTFTWQKGMPDQWKQWLHSVAYWHDELENDNK
jgi:5-methylcytosine-specific restriction endonuclease McrA